jgi:Smg protein
MKETVLDVLMYLFDNYIEEDIELNPDQESLKAQLKQAGFVDHQVDKAFNWLEGLTLLKEDLETSSLTEDTPSLRMFSDIEIKKLNVECRGFLLFLEQAGVLDANDREHVIDRVMALDADGIDLRQLKWVILMVLSNQPGKEAAFAWMEDIVMDDVNAILH